MKACFNIFSMKRISLFVGLFAFVFLLKAQDDIVLVPEMEGDTPTVKENLFLESLSKEEEGKGVVHLYQTPGLADKIGNPGVNTPENIVIIEDKTYLQMTGFRIQVFSGNNQATAKTEAFRKEAAIKANSPGLMTYVKYSAPFWRLRVGDFLTYEDAYEVLLQFKKTFVFGREMSIVREKINIPL